MTFAFKELSYSAVEAKSQRKSRCHDFKSWPAFFLKAIKPNAVSRMKCCSSLLMRYMWGILLIHKIKWCARFICWHYSFQISMSNAVYIISISGLLLFRAGWSVNYSCMIMSCLLCISKLHISANKWLERSP